MKNIILVFIGGGVGSTMRYALGFLLNNEKNNMPSGTLIANTIGCFLIGIFAGIWGKQNSLYLLMAIGFCGGFTTLSSLSNEMFLMIKSNQVFQPILYLFITILLGLLATFVGYILAGYISNN